MDGYQLIHKFINNISLYILKCANTGMAGFKFVWLRIKQDDRILIIVLHGASLPKRENTLETKCCILKSKQTLYILVYLKYKGDPLVEPNFGRKFK